ncbi:MAG TPA: BON domain-containing protein [Pirellula sp.]|nr:BON domain-containing protein [Pirellula sp.]
MRYSSIAILIAMSCAGCDKPYNATPETTTQPVSTNRVVDRDNTAVNKRDRDSATKTPLDQNENKKDIGITADIRKRVVDTKMSVNAQNVKIITQDGKVTLRGPVKTADEKKQIEEMARSVAGENNVDSQLEVEQTP